MQRGFRRAVRVRKRKTAERNARRLRLDDAQPDGKEARCVRQHVSVEEENVIALRFRDQAIAACKLPPNPSGEIMEGSSLSTLVQMVSSGVGVTLIPEMAVAVETRSAAVSVARFRNPQPSRTIGMVWRKTSPLARQLTQISEIVCRSAGRKPAKPAPRHQRA